MEGKNEVSMLLYICEICGDWQDASIGSQIKKIFAIKPSESPQPLGPVCLFGHGYMRQVKPDDKICIVEKIQRNCDATINVEIGDKRYKGELHEVKNDG